MFARCEQQAGHSKATCEPWANQINWKLPRFGPQFLCFYSGRTDLAKNWANRSRLTKCYHSISYAGRRNVYFQRFILHLGWCLCVYAMQQNRNSLVKMSLCSATSGQKLHMVPLSDIFSARCLQTVEFFLYCSFAIFTSIRDLQLPVWLHSSLSYLTMKPEGCETTLLTEFFLVLDEGITFKTKVGGEKLPRAVDMKDLNMNA